MLDWANTARLESMCNRGDEWSIKIFNCSQKTKVALSGWHGILSKEGKTLKPPYVKPGFSYSLSCWDLFDRLISFRPLGRSDENSSICCDARLYVLDPLQR